MRVQEGSGVQSSDDIQGPSLSCQDCLRHHHHLFDLQRLGGGCGDVEGRVSVRVRRPSDESVRLQDESGQGKGETFRPSLLQHDTNFSLSTLLGLGADGGPLSSVVAIVEGNVRPSQVRSLKLVRDIPDVGWLASMLHNLERIKARTDSTIPLDPAYLIEKLLPRRERRVFGTPDDRILVRIVREEPRSALRRRVV